MLHPVTQQFVEALNSQERDKGSVYDRAANMTDGVLVVDEKQDASSLARACFEKRFPVAVVLVRHDPAVPRIETASQTIVGEDEIKIFLEGRV